MSILTTIGNFLFGKPPTGGAPSSLRNKAGGMAWVNVGQCGDGSEALNGCIVQTKRVLDGRYWAIDPKQEFIARIPMVGEGGGIVWPGGRATVTAIRDDCLIPIPDTDVTDSEVTSLYEPSPTKETV